MVFIKIAILLAVLLILFAVYEIIGLFRKKARTYYIGDDGNFRSFGNASFNVGTDNYLFHDNNQPQANRYQGYSNVENGLALINLRDNPSANDLSAETHKAGWVDLSGNIYGSSGFRVGYITDAQGRPGINGSGKWYELWLRKHSYVYTCPPLASENGDSETAKDQLIGKIVETGRLRAAKPNRYTTTARAGGFLLLYKDCQPKPKSEDGLISRTTWKDTALPATVLFTFIYGLFYLSGTGKMSFPALGEQIGFTIAMLLVFYAIWFILRQIKIEASLEGHAFDNFLMLIDRNTGVGGLNNWIILASAAALLVSIFIYGSDFVPLQAAILIGAWVNRKYITGEPWEVTSADNDETELPEWSGEEEEGNESDTSGETDIPGVETAERTFKWRLDSLYSSLNGELTLTFNLEKIAELRANNPFKLGPNRGFKANITDLINTCKHNAKVHQVLRYIDQQARETELSELERMQFILDFVQEPNIQYEYDDKCPEIGCPRDYARYPDETMFDGRGDCDCKAMLAAILFREAGHKTAYITTMTHAAIAVAFKDKAASDLVGMASQSLVTKDGYLYFFCETTGDGFKIGDLGSTTKEAIDDIIFLN